MASSSLSLRAEGLSLSKDNVERAAGEKWD
jgi:hypothetical protein